MVDVQNVRSRWQWTVSTQRMVLTTVLMTTSICLSVGVVFVARQPRAILSLCSVILTTSSAFTAPNVGEYFAMLSVHMPSCHFITRPCMHVYVTKQCQLVRAKGQLRPVAGKVAIGLASRWPCVTY